MSTPLNVTHTNLRHHIGHDPVMLALRKKYYSESPIFPVKNTESSPELTQLFLVTDSERGTKFNCLTHPGSYYSPSLVGTEFWNRDQWAALSRSITRISNWGICRFNMLTSAQVDRLTAELRRARLSYDVSSAQFRVISGNQSFKEYVDSRRSSFNANQRRCRRLMDKNGFSYTTDLDIEQVMQVFSARNPVKGSDDYSVQDNFRGFLRELRQAYKNEGRWYECGIVKEGMLYAFTVGFWDEDNVFYAFQTCYDPQFHNLRLGALTFEKLIEDVFARGCTHISFMGDSEYFRLFTNEAYRFHAVDVFSRSPLGYFLFVRRKALKLASTIKRHVLPMIRRLRSMKPAAAAATTS